MGESVRSGHFEEFEWGLIDLATQSEKSFIGTFELIDTLEMVTTDDELRRRGKIMDKFLDESE
jgi:hypothetical protein